MAEAPVVERQGFGPLARTEAARPAQRDVYTTFPRELAPSLAGAGGILALMGGLGTWILATEQNAEGVLPTPAASLQGLSEPSGRGIAVFGALVIFVAAVTYFTRFLPRLTLEVMSVLLSGVLLARLLALDSRASEMAEVARQRLGFETYHAGFGWGAWTLLLALVLLMLAALVGGLRELDIRRGVAE